MSDEPGQPESTMAPGSADSSSIESVAVAYRELLPGLSAFERSLEALVSALFASERIPVHQIQVRCKSEQSLRDKIASRIQRGTPYANPLKDITDLVGVRSILYYQEDVNLAVQLIRREFAIDEAHSTGARKPSGTGEFGYRSYHLVARLDDRRAMLSEWMLWKDLPVEFQIRSILDHAWAEIEHSLCYEKRRMGLPVPESIVRTMARQMAKLEEIDDVFSDLRNRLDEAAAASEDGIDDESSP